MASSSLGTENKELRTHHNNLADALYRNITDNQFIKLKQQFHQKPFGDRELENITNFLELWRQLDSSFLSSATGKKRRFLQVYESPHCERSQVIRVNDYTQLKLALESIGAKCHLDTIQEFEYRMNSNKEGNDHIPHRNTPITKLELIKLKEKLQPLLEDETVGHLVGSVHAFENAVLGLIPRSGGVLKLMNGTAKLEIPPNVFTNNHQEMFWIYRHIADDKNKYEPSYLKAATRRSEPEIMEYSLPVELGPPGVGFDSPVLLTLKEYSFPDPTTSSQQMSVYRSVQDNGTWEKCGSCFPDRSSKTVYVPLNTMSSYVFGMPSESKLIPFNAHVMVQRLPQKMDAICNSNEIRMVFSMNDYSYNQEIVSRNLMDIMCETCYYLHPKNDVIIKLGSRDANGSIRINQTVVLEKGRLYNLAEKIQSVTIPIKNTDQGSRIFVRLEQDNNVLVELSYINDKPKAMHPKIYPPTNGTDEFHVLHEYLLHGYMKYTAAFGRERRTSLRTSMKRVRHPDSDDSDTHVSVEKRMKILHGHTTNNCSKRAITCR